MLRDARLLNVTN